MKKRKKYDLKKAILEFLGCVLIGLVYGLLIGWFW